MKLYAAMDTVFRRSYAVKLFAVAFVGTHIPLLALLGWSLWRGWDSDPLLVQVAILCLLATLAGTALTFYLLHGLLAPVRASAAALHAFDHHAALPQLPEDGHDDAGVLMRGLNRSLRRIDDGIRQLEWTASMAAPGWPSGPSRTAMRSPAARARRQVASAPSALSKPRARGA